MTWFTLAILSVIFFSLATIAQRLMMKDDDSDPTAFMIVFQFLVTAVIVGYFLITKLPIPNILPVLPNLLFNGFLIAVASLSMFKGLKLIEAADFTIIGTSSTFWGLITASIFLKEAVTVEKVIGTILIVLGIVVITAKKKEGKFSFQKGHLYSLISATAFGISFTNEAFIVGQIGVMQNLLIGFFLPGFIVLLLYPKSVVKMKLLLKPNNIIKMTIFSLFYLFGAIAIFAAYKAGGDVSKIFPIGKAEVIFTAILGALILKEYDHPIKKILGVLTTFAGVLLLR